MQTNSRVKWIMAVTAFSTPSAAAQAWGWCRGHSSSEQGWLQTGRFKPWSSTGISDLEWICVGCGCWSAGKWTSNAFTVSLWLWEAAWQFKIGIANGEMLMPCRKDGAKRSLQAGCPHCSEHRQLSPGINTTLTSAPNPFALLAELEQLFIHCRAYSASLHISKIHLLISGLA